MALWTYAGDTLSGARVACVFVNSLAMVRLPDELLVGMEISNSQSQIICIVGTFYLVLYLLETLLSIATS